MKEKETSDEEFFKKYEAYEKEKIAAKFIMFSADDSVRRVMFSH